MERAEAQDFLHELRVWSTRCLAARGIPTNTKNRRSWGAGHPNGEIDHYTAGVSFWGSCSWGNSVDNHDSSFPFVLADRKLPTPVEPPALVKKYCPATVMMLSDLSLSHWHGNWTNGWTIGKEHRNVGALRKKGDKFFWWGGEYNPELLGAPVLIDGRWYEPYSVEQLVSSIWLSRAFAAIYPMDPSWILPHSAIRSSKMDTGRAFPMNLFRAAVVPTPSPASPQLLQWDPYDLPWMRAYKSSPAKTLVDLEEREHARYAEIMLAQISGAAVVGDDVYVRDEDFDGVAPDFDEEVASLIDEGDWRKRIPDVVKALHLLGYHVLSPAYSAGDPVVEYGPTQQLAVWQFQKSFKELVADKVPGINTRKALYARLCDFQLESLTHV